MGVVVKYVEADKRTGRLSYRRIYPAELRPFVPGQVRELKRSLRSSNIHSPEATHLYAEAQAEYERYVASARRVSAGITRPLIDTDTPFLIASYAYQLRKNLHDTHWDDTDASRDWLTTSAWRYAPLGFMDAIGADMAGRATPWTNAERLREALPGLIAEWRTIRANGVRAALIDAEGQTAEDLCREHGITVDPQSAAFFALCRQLLDADLFTAQNLARTVDPEDATPLEVPDAPEPLAASSEANSKPSHTKAASVPLLDLFNGYATAQGIAPRGRNEWGNAIRHFISFLGHDDAARVTREDVIGWRDALLASPTRYGKARKPVTVRDKYIVALRCTLAWAVAEGRLADNAALGVAVRTPRSIKTRDKDFTLAEAHTILRASLAPPPAKLSAPSARARRWIPWLCAYSGARVGELAQLRTEDVKLDEGVWVMNLTPAAGTIKTREARLVPLHPHLIDQGFLDVIQSLPPGPIFYDPDKRRADDATNNRHVQKVGERLAKWVRSVVGITDPDLQPNHAWRHLFKTIAGEAGIAEKTADAIQGHTPANVSRRYGKVSVKTKADAMETFPRFVLSS